MISYDLAGLWSVYDADHRHRQQLVHRRRAVRGARDARAGRRRPT